MTKVAMNGLGGSERLARAICEQPECGLELVSIDDLAEREAVGRLFRIGWPVPPTTAVRTV